MVGSLVQDDRAIDWASGVYALKEREWEDWVQVIEGLLNILLNIYFLLHCLLSIYQAPHDFTCLRRLFPFMSEVCLITSTATHCKLTLYF